MNKTITYKELKQKHEQAINKFTHDNCEWCFGHDALKKLCEKLNLTEQQINEKYMPFIGGGIVLKEAYSEWQDICDKHYIELRNLMLTNIEFAKSAFLYEFSNYECCYSYRYGEVFNALCITRQDISENEVLHTAFTQSKNEYLEWCADNC